MASPGWAALGNTIAGGNELPSTIAYEQGMSLGANTQNALAEARSRIDKNNAMEHLDQNLADSIPDPKQRAVIVQSMLSGVDPRNVTGAQADQFKLGQQQQVADVNTSPEQTARSLLAIGQNANLTHAVGDNGNLINELHPGQVQMSDLGAKIAQGTVDKDAASAAASNSEVPLHESQARMADAIAKNGGSRTIQPYAPLIGDDGNPVIDQKTGLPALTQRQGGSADINAPKPQGAVEARMMNRSLDAATQSVKDLAQVTQLPVGANSGLLGYGATPGKTFLQSLKGDLTNRMAPDEVAQYNVVSSGMSRALASLESAGQIPSGTFQNSFDKLQVLDGDNVEQAMLKLSKQRQIIESALSSTITENPRVPDKSKAVAQGLLDQLAQVIPFEPKDIIKLHNGSGKQSLGEVMGQKMGAAPVTANSTPAAAAPLNQNDQPAVEIPAGAMQLLAQHPELKPQFLAKYGALPPGMK